MTRKQLVVERLTHRLQQAERSATRVRTYENRLRAQGRAKAFRLALKLVKGVL